MAYTYQKPADPFEPTALWDKKTRQPAGPQGTNTNPYSTSYDPNANDGNQAVLQTAQTAAIQGMTQPHTTLNQTSQATQQLLKNPSGQFNPQQYKTLQMDQFNRDQGNQLEALRQQTAPVANTGSNLQGLIGVALQHGQQRADLDRGIDLDLANKTQEDLIKAIAEGRQTSQSESDINAQAINNLVNVRGSAEGEENRTLQEKLEADKNWLTQQGIDLQKAEIEGYTDASGKHVMGKLELAAAQYGIDLGRWKDAQFELYGGKNPVTGEQSLGTVAQANAKLGLEAKTVENATKELFGWTDADGMYHKGKYDLLTDEAKREADALYGYWDPQADAFVPGQFQQKMTLMNLEQQFTMVGLNFQALMNNLQDMPPEQAAAVINQTAVSAGITYTDENGVVRSGVKPLDPQQMAAVQVESAIMPKIQAGQTLTEEEFANFVQSPQYNSIPKAETTLAGFEGSWNRTGYNRWTMPDSLVTYLDANPNALVNEGGRIYRISGYYNPPANREGHNKWPSITLVDIQSGESKILESPRG